MSASNKEFTLKKKPRIASGWAAYPSKSYPNKMYYFNVDSGSSSWDEPILKQFSGSDDGQCSGKSDVISKSSSIGSEISLHKSHEVILTSNTKERLETSISNSGMSHKSHEVKLTVAKKCDKHRIKQCLTGPYTKNHKKTPINKTSANDKICRPEGVICDKTSVGKGPSSCNSTGYEYQNSRGTTEEAVLRKRKWKQRSSGSGDLSSDSDTEKPPSRKIKLNHNGSCQSSNNRLIEMICSNKKNGQSVLPSTMRGSSSSTSSASEMHAQHTLKAKKQNKINLEHAAVNDGLHNSGSRSYITACDSGLAAKRLKALQSKLAEEQERKKNSADDRVLLSDLEDDLQRPLYTLHNTLEQFRMEKSPLKPKVMAFKGHIPVRGFSKCNAAKRLETLQKKLTRLHNMTPKQMNSQDILPVNKLSVPESQCRGLHSKERSPSSNTDKYDKYDIHIRENGRFPDQIMKQNLFEQQPHLTANMTKSEDELMEWEPIKDEKILLHIQEVRSQIQQDGGINQDERGILKVNYGMSSVFSADGKPEWFIVLDTNILVSSVEYVEELRDTNFKGLGFPVLVIPWQVLQELDILKDQRGSVKSSSLTARARRAVSFLHSNFTSKHPRIRGQTALDAVPKDFKVEVPDDAILQCCLQVAQRTNRVILLSNDKNLCNKAIVNGIKASQKSGIQHALEELSSDVEHIQIQSSSGNELSVTNMYTPALTDPVPSDKGASVADTVLCKLKLLLKELLSRVLENEMYKVYDISWKSIVIVKPPWTLSDIIICLLKHWISVFRFVLHAEVKPILESLKEFFGSTTHSKGYGHSLLEVKTILQGSLHLCMGIQSNEYHDMVSTCMSNIERLQQHCEETWTEEEKFKSSVKNVVQNEDMKAVIDVLEKCWDLVHLFCAVMCDVLGLEHHMVYRRPEPFPTVDVIRDRLPYIYPRVHTLIRNITSIRELPVSVLTVDHEAVKNLCLTLTDFLLSQEVEERVTPELILKFCTSENTRNTLEEVQAKFEEMKVVLDRGVNYFVQSGIA